MTQHYILTCDTGEKLRAIRHHGLSVPPPSSSLIQDIQDELKTKIKASLPEIDVISIGMSELADEILAGANQVHAVNEDIFVVSTCSEIAQPEIGATLQINRLIDLQGNVVGIGPRPGHPTVPDQLKHIRVLADGHPVVLVEDGVFTGGTLRFIVQAMLKERIRPAGVAVGFSFPQSQPTLDWLTNQGISVWSAQQFGDLLDWVPDHDFLPFIPGCGKVIGAKLGSENLPWYSYNHASYAVPYLYPFSPMQQWTSIPKDDGLKISIFCLQAVHELFIEIGRLNGHEIVIGEILHARQRVSIPVELGQQYLPKIDSTVVSYLSDTLHALS